MTFEEKILKNCEIRQRNLLRAALVASKKPDTGVTINKRGAYFVIKDCADITHQYLAHLGYSSLSSPLTRLKGKFTQAEIIDFVGRSKEEAHTRQLLHIILTDIGSAQYKSALGTKDPQPTPGVTVSVPSHDYTIRDDEDVYGDYDFEEQDTLVNEPVTVDSSEEIDVDDVTAVINTLIDIFGAK
jgi:hypothetical protein